MSSIFTLVVYARAGGEGSLRIPVRVVKRRQNFGREDALVTPLRGSGTVWIQARKLQPLEETS